MAKKFILNADNLGKDSAHNIGIVEGYQGGILKSASITANGDAFDDAINSVIPACKDLSLGLHLNLTDGKPLCNDLTGLTDENGNFKNSFLSLLIRAYNPKDKEFLSEIEREFRAQTEKVTSKIKITHIDSNCHIHAIPPIFKIVCKIAQDYDIKYIRTHYERPYIVPDVFVHLSLIWLKNICKAFLLNLFTIFNENTAANYNLKTNDYIIGIIYNSLMSSLVMSYGLPISKYKNVTVEAVIEPCRYENGIIDSHFNEFMITKNKKLKDKVEALGFEITGYEDEKPEEEK